MLTTSFKSLSTAALITVAWVFGTIELIDTLRHFSTQWYWYIIALIYTITINDLFVHICCGHNIYPIDTTRPGYKILSFLATVDNAWGPISSMCLVHGNHHMYADQGNKDVSNWRIHWYNMGIISPINFIYQAATVFPNADQYFARQRRLFKDILDDTWLWFIEEYSHVFTLIFWCLLYWLCPVILFKVIFMGRVIMSLFTLLPGMLGHTWIPGGYRNFKTPDTSYNNLLIHYFCLCIYPTVLQNNHHGQIYSLKTGHRYRWFELDLSVYIVRLIKKITEKRNVNNT